MASRMNRASAASLALAVLATLFAIFTAVWKIDEHFVTRREFNQLAAEVRAIREHFRIPEPETP